MRIIAFSCIVPFFGFVLNKFHCDLDRTYPVKDWKLAENCRFFAIEFSELVTK